MAHNGVFKPKIAALTKHACMYIMNVFLGHVAISAMIRHPHNASVPYVYIRILSDA